VISKPTGGLDADKTRFASGKRCSAFEPKLAAATATALRACPEAFRHCPYGMTMKPNTDPDLIGHCGLPMSVRRLNVLLIAGALSDPLRQNASGADVIQPTTDDTALILHFASDGPEHEIGYAQPMHSTYLAWAQQTVGLCTVANPTSATAPAEAAKNRYSAVLHGYSWSMMSWHWPS
jgi:hypothetical protein